MVAGAGPTSPAKGTGELMKGDEGTWSPFFCNQWYALRDRQFSDEISKYMVCGIGVGGVCYDEVCVCVCMYV